MIFPLGILHLTTYLQGGAGRAITDLACAQREAGHDVTVVTSETPHGAFGNYPEYLQRLRAHGVALHTCDSLFTRDLAINSRVADVLRRRVNVRGVDIIHAHAAVPAFIGQLYAGRAARRIPIVQTQHGWGTNKTAAQAAFDVDMLRRVDGVITTSAATRDLLVRYGAYAAAISVVPCGLAATAPDPLPAGDEHWIEPLRRRGLAVVGCVGSVTANKNQRLLVDALPQLRDAGVAAVFVGEGSEALAERARGLGVGDRVIACGYQPEASRWLPMFDAVVQPSRTEGQGLVVLEAFRAGVPVVASDIPALSELIDHQRNGFLFEADNADALAAAIRSALRLTAAERRAITSAALAQFQAGFTIDRMVARHEAVYRELRREETEGLEEETERLEEETESTETISTQSSQRTENAPGVKGSVGLPSHRA